MNMSKNKEENKYKPEDFMKAVEEISKKMGYTLSIYPTFAQQDNGTFSLKIVQEVIKRP